MCLKILACAVSFVNANSIDLTTNKHTDLSLETHKLDVFLPSSSVRPPFCVVEQDDSTSREAAAVSSPVRKRGVGYESMSLSAEGATRRMSERRCRPFSGLANL